MTTARAESIGRSRTHFDAPITAPGDHTLVENKIDHYAALGRVIHEAVLSFTADPEIAESLQSATSSTNLRHRFSNGLSSSISDVLTSGEFAAAHRHLATSQSQRAELTPGIWDMIEGSIAAGTSTFVNTTQAVYELLSAEFSTQAAEVPQSAAILDRLAKLNIAQFIPYRDVYLETAANRQAFTDQLMPEGDGMRFKPGFPFQANVPVVLTAGRSIQFSSDTDLHDVPLIQVKDIPEDRVTIGCPITFYSGQISELWSMYTSARRSLRRRKTLGLKAGSVISFDDSAAS